MAKSRKQQRTARGAVAKAAEAVKEKVVDVVKATTKVAESYVVDPVKNVLGLGQKKPPKKRHVRPARQAATAEPAPLARGKSNSARTMSAGIAKSVGGRASAETADGSSALNRAQGASSAKTETSARANRRRAKRRTGES